MNRIRAVSRYKGITEAVPCVRHKPVVIIACQSRGAEALAGAYVIGVIGITVSLIGQNINRTYMVVIFGYNTNSRLRHGEYIEIAFLGAGDFFSDSCSA